MSLGEKSLGEKSLGEKSLGEKSRREKNNNVVCMPPHSHPGIVDARQAGLRLVQHEEGRQVGRVGGDDDHGEAGPHHAQDARAEAPGRAWREGESVFSPLRFVLKGEEIPLIP